MECSSVVFAGKLANPMLTFEKKKPQKFIIYNFTLEVKQTREN